MATGRRKWLGWLAGLGAVAVLAGGLWYAHARGWLQFQQMKSDHGGMAGMNMPGMDMGSMSKGEPGKASGVPGHAEVTIPGEIRQRIGVTIGEVEKGPLKMTVRTVGIVRPNETKLARIHLKVEGWVEKLYVNYTGQSVRKGDPLLAIYSPQFLTTQQEYLTARSGSADRESLAEAAQRRLELWDVPPKAIKELKETGRPQKYLTLDSPLTGTVLAKDVTEKQYVTPQKELYFLADLSTVWVQAKVYEYELPHVQLDQPARVTLPAVPDKTFTGKVVFIEPTVERTTRTVQVRVELPNPEGLLKPDMFAHVEIEHSMGEGLLVPSSAIIRTGERDIAFRVESPGRFRPVELKIAPLTFGERYQVLEGLKAGDRVATSANFLIDSESRLRAGVGGMAGMAGMDMADMK